jgi:hypothetical protein
MGKIDAKATKETILKFLEEKGPSLPVQLAKATGLNSIFTSAFLSELASEGTVKISNMKVGGSPLYFLSHKKEMLENFINFLGPKEREAQTLLKQKDFLEDREQTPVIRVALRGLKDFAIPLKYPEGIIWRYYLAEGEPIIKSNKLKEEHQERQVTEKLIDDMMDEKSEFKTPEERFEEKQEEIKKKNQENDEEIKRKLEAEKQKKLEEAQEIEKIKQELEEKRKELAMLKNELQGKPEIKKIHKKPIKQKIVDESFLNEVKEILIKKGMDTLEIMEFDKKEAILKIKKEGKEMLLFAFDRKKVEESELIKAHKKASLLNLGYQILFKGETPKKLKETIEAYKNLGSIERFE